LSWHLGFHQARFDQTRRELFGTQERIVLADILTPPKNMTCRIRVTYAQKIEQIEYIEYQPREMRSFALVETTQDYRYKSCDRTFLNEALRADADDVIFVKEGLLTDTTIANIALWIEGEWKTPLAPLLEGTTRARLLASGFLKAEHLSVSSLQKARKFAIMNALIGFKTIENVLMKE
jgi:4-amino-4-deoxychorismate lyase